MPMLESASYCTAGAKQELTLLIADADHLTGPLQAQLVLHDDVAVAWCASLSCERQESTWIGAIGEPSWGMRPIKQLLELAQLQDATGNAVQITNRVFFLEPSGEGDWQTGPVAEAEYLRLQSEREARFGAPLLAPSSRDSDPFFAVVMLVDNLLLTKGQRIPGIEILPLSATSLGHEEVLVLNSVLQDFGFARGVDPHKWVEQMQHRRPAAVVHIRRCRAEDARSALSYSRQTAHQLLDLLALRRGDAPRLLGGVVGALDAQDVPRASNFWIEGTGYSGNLMGGMIAGEDIHGLLLFWEGLSQEPRARLWLSLFADAMAEDRWDYQLFRCFNIVEGIATEVVPSNVPVLDNHGNPRLQPNGKLYTTSEARGKIYELLRSTAAIMQASESNFTTEGPTSPHPDNPSIDLWDEIGLWLKVRNAVAHRGSWELPAGQEPSADHLRVEATIASFGFDGSFAYGVTAVLRTIKTAVKSTLIAALRGKLTYVER